MQLVLVIIVPISTELQVRLAIAEWNWHSYISWKLAQTSIASRCGVGTQRVQPG